MLKACEARRTDCLPPSRVDVHQTVIADFMHSPGPLSSCDKEETSVTQWPLTDLSQAFARAYVTGTSQGMNDM